MTTPGIGIIDCDLPTIPSRLIRDHHRGALRVKQCQVGEMQTGFIDNIDEVKQKIETSMSSQHWVIGCKLFNKSNETPIIELDISLIRLCPACFSSTRDLL